MSAAALQVCTDQLDLAQIATLLGIDKRSAERRAESGQWLYTTTPHKGNPKRWYALQALPDDVQAAYARALQRDAARQRLQLAEVSRQALANIQLPAPVNPATTSPDTQLAPAAQTARAVSAAPLVMSGQVRRVVADMGKLTPDERAIVEGSLMLCVAVDERIGGGARSAKMACGALAQQLHAGQAGPELIGAARTTYQRPRRCAADPHGVGLPAALTRRLERLYGFYRAGLAVGDAARYLVPARKPRVGERMRPEDRLAFLAHYCKPSRPTPTQAWRDSEAWYLAHGFERPAKDTFYRLEHVLPVWLKCRGRMTGSAWKALMPHRSRDVSMFFSNDIWVGDGHTFKARVASPIHGKAFRPEVTLVMDWRSRKIVGWSVDLAESTQAVSAAFRDAQLRTRARPLVYYRDNGSGQTGKLIDCDVHGTLARQGIASETGIPGNPQGRGVMERIWQTVLIPFAAQYPTFLGAQADPETVRKASIQVQKDQRAGNISALLPSWQTFMADLARHIEAYNTSHKHRALGGMTPDEAYAKFMDADSLVFGVDDAEIHALWLPEVERTPRRGLFELFHNRYFLPSLVAELPEGSPVRVRFDIHRAETVQVLAMDGTPLGVATWEGNRTAAFPVPFMDRERRKRVERFERDQDEKRAAKREELWQTVDVPALPVPAPVPDLLSMPLPQRRAEPERAPSFLDSGIRLMEQYGEAPPRRREDETPSYADSMQRLLELEERRRQERTAAQRSQDDQDDGLRVAAG